MATEVHRITEVHEVHRIFLLPRASPYHSVSAHLTLLFAHTELYSRQAIRDARLISNPGCYATSIQALIAPLLPFLDGARPPTVFGVSGYSGAGTKAGQSGSTPGSQPVTVPKISAEDLAGGVRPYALTDHIHEREAARHLSRLAGSDVGVAFVPAVAPWFQGIISTLSAPLKQKMTAKQVREAYEAFYEGQQLVELGPNVPEVKVRALLPPSLLLYDPTHTHDPSLARSQDIALQHGIKIGGIQVHSGGERVVVVGGLDNLLKGAATQCIQVSLCLQ
jgi:N-acetyl-gamma-glutamyl-phosphate reductase/acetylglutamate kinase